MRDRANSSLWKGAPPAGLTAALTLILFAVPHATFAAEVETPDLLQEIEPPATGSAELEQFESRLAELEEQTAKDRGIKIGGALSLEYHYRDFDEASRKKRGDIGFTFFRIKASGAINDLLLSVQYHWYSYMHAICEGWIGHDFTDNLQAQFGVTPVPFGILPYASHNFWEGVPYYVGLEDDHDLGLKLLYKEDPWDLQIAFFKNAEWGSSSDTERHSYDVIAALGQDNEETNQLNARLAYTFQNGDENSTEVGLSGQLGQVYNGTTESLGTHWAAAAHVNGRYGRFNLMLEAARYQYAPKNPVGVDDSTVVIGGFADAYEIAAEGTVLVAGLSYDMPVSRGRVTKLTFYNDYSVLLKDEGSFHDSHINTLGCMISANPLVIYIDIIMGKNAQYLGGPADSFAGGDPWEDWHTLFNINIGYYF